MTKEDLSKYHSVKNENITVCGSSQLTYMESYLASPRAKSKQQSKIFYYICGHGYPGNVDQEVELIRILSKAITAHAHDHKLMVRPYPNQANWDIYKKLQNEIDVVLDDQYRDGKTGREQTIEDIYLKYDRIRDATAVFHAGTTLGLEASFLETPVFMFYPFDWDLGASKKSEHISNVFKFQHLRRYLVKDSPNVIRKTNEIESCIRLAIDDVTSALKYNQACASQFQLAPMETVANRIITAMTGIALSESYKRDSVEC